MGSSNAGLFGELQTVKSENYIRFVQPEDLFNTGTTELQYAYDSDSPVEFLPGDIVVEDEDGLAVKANDGNADLIGLKKKICWTNTANRTDVFRVQGGTTGAGPAYRTKGITAIAFNCIADVNGDTFFESGSVLDQQYIVATSLTNAGKAMTYSKADWETLVTTSPELIRRRLGVISGKSDTPGFTRVQFDGLL